MWTSSEKMNYLPDIVTRFNQAQHTTASVFPDGTKQAIHVRLMSINSGTMSDHLIRKLRDQMDFPAAIPAPHIVSPSVDHWLSRVIFATGVQVFDPDSTKDLALSPVVIATYEEMARALGWPNKSLGWEEIIALAQSPEGWATYPSAKVEWGRKPLLAWTDPFVSSTARLAQEILPELRRLGGKHQQLGQELRGYRGEQGGRLRPNVPTAPKAILRVA
jgi:Ca-activated chloride channel homolog